MPTVRPDFYLKQGDSLPAILADLIDSQGTLVDLSGSSVRFLMKKRGDDTVAIDAEADIIDEANGRVQYEWNEGDPDALPDPIPPDTNETGIFEVEWIVTFPDGRQQTFPSDGFNYVKIARDLDTTD